MKRYRYFVPVVLVWVTFAYAATDTARAPVSDIKALLARAAVQGSAYGVLVGTSADQVARRFQSSAPIELDVVSLHVLSQPGCGRLRVTTRQRDVLEAGERHDKEFSYQVSFCADGNFPEKK